MDKIKPISFKNLKKIFNEMSSEKGMLGLTLIKELEFMKKTLTKLKKELHAYSKVVINNTENSIPYTLNFSIKNIRSMDIQKELEKHEIYVSTKTSCCPVTTPSKLVYALTKDKNKALSSIRVSLSHLTTEKEIDQFLSIFNQIYKEYENNGKI